MSEEEKIPSKFQAIVIEIDQGLAIIYYDDAKQLKIKQFWFEIKDGKTMWDGAEMFFNKDEVEDFKNAIDEIADRSLGIAPPKILAPTEEKPTFDVMQLVELCKKCERLGACQLNGYVCPGLRAYCADSRKVKYKP